MAVAVVLAVLDWTAVAVGSRLLERCAKPAVLLALLAAALTAEPRHPGVHGWLVLALCLGLIGDVALSFAEPGQPVGQRLGQPVGQRAGAATTLEPVGSGQQQQPSSRASAEQAPPGQAPPEQAPPEPTTGQPTTGQPTTGGPHRAAPPVTSDRADAHQPPSVLFTVGLASFLLGHLCYAAAMLKHGTEQLSLGFGLALVLLALLAFGHQVLAGAQSQGGAPLMIAVAAYITALGSTVVLGIGTSSLWVAYGIVAFAASDLVLATDRFVARRGWAPLTVAISYHLAQSLLLLGLVG